jgi:hypothetical protein
MPPVAWISGANRAKNFVGVSKRIRLVRSRGERPRRGHHILNPSIPIMSAKNSTVENPIAASDSANPVAETPGGCVNSPPPGREHEWLQRFVGEWEAEIEACMEPGQPPMRSTGEERARMLGGFWLISEGRNSAFPFSFVFTLGFDPGKSRYVATWVDTMSGHLWTYEGEVDTTGEILTLDTEGPFPMAPGKRFKFREITRFVNAGHRVFTSSLLGEDGNWSTMLTVNSRRKK